MKALVILGAFATASLAQTAQFTNTSFSSPYTVGQTVHLMWTTGNGLPVSLSILNSTWNYKIFSGRAVLPTTYDWTVTAVPGFASGAYQLALEQVGGSVSNSSSFGVIVPGAANITNATSTVVSAAPATATVTYVYFDQSCGCTKTATVANPMAVTTTIWWDDHCGCHKSTMVPVTTLPASSAPLTTTIPTPAPTVVSAPSTTTRMPAPATFTGEAVRLDSSMIGMAALMAAAVLF